MSEDVWYYAHGGERHGPVSLDALRELASQGKLDPEDLVWGPGMESWAPARGVEGVWPGPVPPPLEAPGTPLWARGRAFFDRAAKGVGKLDAGAGSGASMPHVRLVARVLAWLEKVFSVAVLDAIDRFATSAGHIAYVAAAVLFALFYAALAIKQDSMQLFFVSLLAILPLALVGHYIASQFLEAGKRLVASLPTRVFSKAFLNCVGLLFFFGALFLAGNGLYSLVRAGNWQAMGYGLAMGALLVYLGGISLRPESLNITIDETAAAGEEALGIFSFAGKLLLRLVPVVFGVGTITGTVLVLYFFVQLFRDEIFSIQFPIVALWSILDVTVGVLGLGIFPLWAYFVFVVYHLGIDVVRAILSVPGKLDALRRGVGEK